MSKAQEKFDFSIHHPFKTELQGPRGWNIPLRTGTTLHKSDTLSVVLDGSVVTQFLQDFSMTTTDNQRSCS